MVYVSSGGALHDKKKQFKVGQQHHTGKLVGIGRQEFDICVLLLLLVYRNWHPFSSSSAMPPREQNNKYRGESNVPQKRPNRSSRDPRRAPREPPKETRLWVFFGCPSGLLGNLEAPSEVPRPSTEICVLFLVLQLLLLPLLSAADLAYS